MRPLVCFTLFAIPLLASCNRSGRPSDSASTAIHPEDIAWAADMYLHKFLLSDLSKKPLAGVEVVVLGPMCVVERSFGMIPIDSELSADQCVVTVAYTVNGRAAHGRLRAAGTTRDFATPEIFESDGIAHLDGDRVGEEFVVLCAEMGSRKDGTQVTEATRRRLSLRMIAR